MDDRKSTGFKKESFQKKLVDLNESQQSIQTVSIWVIHHRKHYKEIVSYWLEFYKKASRPKQLTLMYLANDVIQNSRKKTPHYVKEFSKVLPDALKLTAKEVDEKIKAKIERVIKIWEEREIYNKDEIKSFASILSSAKVVPASNGQNKPDDKKRKSVGSESSSDAKKPKRLIDELDTRTMKSMLAKIVQKIPDTLPGSPEITKFDPKVDGEKLMNTLQELEKCPSADVALRTKIANFPSEVFDLTLIDSAIKKDAGSTTKWLNAANEAKDVLTDYNRRLKREIEDRTKSFAMLAKLLEIQKSELADAEKSYNETREKLKKCDTVREELKSHIESLPDLSQLNQVAALPSVVDLFQKPRN